MGNLMFTFKRLVNEAVLREGVWKDIMKGVRSSQNYAPFTVVAIENGKVVAQHINIKIPDAIPAYYEDIKRNFPRAHIHIEDSGGEVVWSAKR